MNRYIWQGIDFLGIHYRLGLWAESVMDLSRASIPFIFLALFLGYQINKKISAQKFAYYIYYFLIIVGLVFCVKPVVFFLG